MASTCLDIITQALRQIKVLGSGAIPTAAESEDGLFALQSIVDGLFGNGVGLPLTDVDVSSSDDVSNDLLADSRVLVATTSSLTLTFPETPANGARMQVKDMSGTFATYPVTIDGNGRHIEGAATLTANLNNFDTTWIYVADTANWAKVEALATSDLLAFNDDEFFTLALAKKLAGPFGAQFSPSDETALLRAANRIRAKFASSAVTPADDAVRYLSRQSYNPGWMF